MSIAASTSAGLPGTVRAAPTRLGPNKLCGEPALVAGQNRARSLLGHRLTQILRRQADFLAELEQLLLGELARGFAAARSLQLRGAREHALERGAVECDVPADRTKASRAIGEATESGITE